MFVQLRKIEGVASASRFPFCFVLFCPVLGPRHRKCVQHTHQVVALYYYWSVQSALKVFVSLFILSCPPSYLP